MEIERPDPSELRVSDADRHQVAEILREAAGEGRLELDELDERLEATYRAKTYGELVPITLDLPTPGHPQPPAAAPVRGGPAPHHDSTLVLIGAQKRAGMWEIGATHSAFALMGAITLDLREARFHSRTVVLNASTVMGAIEIIVDRATRVRVEGVGVMGAYEEGRPRTAPEFGPDSPLVRIRGVALMGNVTVIRKDPRRLRLRGRRRR